MIADGSSSGFSDHADHADHEADHVMDEVAGEDLDIHAGEAAGESGSNSSGIGNGRQRAAAIRPTEAEYEERVEAVLYLLRSGKQKGTIKKFMKAKYGVCARTIETYLARARQALLAESQEGRDWLRASSLGIYRSIIADPNASHRTKIKAQERIDKLMGLEAPAKIAQTDTHGNDVDPEARRSRLAALAECLRGR